MPYFTASINSEPERFRLKIFGRDAMFAQGIFARSGRQNRVFRQNSTVRGKSKDWLAEKIGFELLVAFRRMIALYWPTECVFRRCAAAENQNRRIE